MSGRAKGNEAREKMLCPVCGTPMNQHAEKAREPRDADEIAAMDPVLGGIVEEFHTCPACGWNAARMRS